MDKARLLQHLQSTVLRTPRLVEAFAAIDRGNFVPPDYLDLAYEDNALPLGFGSTISQPSTVAIMLELLQPQVGSHVLDVGSGSGWTTALLGHIVGKNGRVLGVELVPELVKLARRNLASYRLPQVRIVLADSAVLGFPEQAPYDKILVSASASSLPPALVDQLKIGGTLVLPVGDSVYKVDKLSAQKTKIQELPGFAFVPLR